MKRGISITGGQLLRRNDDDTDAPNYTARLSTMPPHRHQLLSVCIVHGEPAAAGRDRRLAREAGWLPASAHDWLDDVLAFEVVGCAPASGRSKSEGADCMAKETSGARARITVKVQPRARATRVAGRMENAYRLQLAAPPVDGKASEACVAYVAELAGVAKSRVRIVSGAMGRMKVVEIEGDRAGGDGAEAGSGSAGGVS